MTIVNKKPENFGTILHKFPILYAGWEMDNVGYVVKAEGLNILVLSNHEKLYVADRVELEEKLQEYKEAIRETEKALELLK